MKWLLILFAACSLVAAAADIDGTWKGTAESPNGTIERTFVFKSHGETLTGETSSEMLGKSTIMDGKIAGDTITFSIKAKFQDNEMTLTYKGKVISPKEIKFDVTSDSGIALQYTVKKIS